MKKNVKTGLVSARRTLRTAATFFPPSHFLEIAELRNCTCEECEPLAVSYLVSPSAGLEGKQRRRGQRFLQASCSPLLMGCKVPRPRWRRRSFGRRAVCGRQLLVKDRIFTRRQKTRVRFLSQGSQHAGLKRLCLDGLSSFVQRLT